MHRNHKHWTADEDTQLERLHMAGNKVRVTARLLGRSPASVKRRLLHKRIMRKVPGKTRAAVRELHAQGFNDCEIARQIGLTPTTVWKHRRNMGLPVIARTADDLSRQLARVVHSGGRYPGQARWEQSKVRAATSGWPEGCNEVQASWLEELRLRPGQVASELAGRFGITTSSALRAIARLRKEAWIVAIGKKPRSYRLTEPVRQGRERYLNYQAEAA